MLLNDRQAMSLWEERWVGHQERHLEPFSDSQNCDQDTGEPFGIDEDLHTLGPPESHSRGGWDIVFSRNSTPDPDVLLCLKITKLGRNSQPHF